MMSSEVASTSMTSQWSVSLSAVGPQERRVGLGSDRVAKWFASQLITGERPLTRNGRRLQQRARQDEGEAEAGHRRGMPGVGLGMRQTSGWLS